MRYVTWRRVKLVLMIVALSLPVALSGVYHALTAPPDVVRIATGPERGRYEAVSRSLQAAIRSEFDIEVELVESTGSLENLRLLEEGAVDLALYQHGARSILRQYGRDPYAGEVRSVNRAEAAFIANLYSEVAHLIVHAHAELDSSSDWRGKRVAVGKETSGDFALSLLFLDHIGLSPGEVDAQQLEYLETEKRLRNGSLDAALITAGPGAPILRQLLGDADEHAWAIRPIPFPEAMAARHIAVAPHTIPAGYYHTHEPIEPETDIETVAFRAQLVTRRDVPTRLVEAVTRIVLDEQFQAENGLAELFESGRAFAADKPEFPVHRGAAHVYEPELKPILNTDFVEATEGIRSFVVSLLVAAYIAYRWWRQREQKSKEHRLDRYIRAVLAIERRQLDYDQRAGADDSDALQDLLDEVTRLREEALSEFTAHEINEDQAVDCFVEMCHALSDKINAKLTRQRFEMAVRELARRLDGAASGESQPTETLDT